MSDSSQFITTVKQLMRLTREGEIDWEERPSVHPNGAPTYKGTYENLRFTLKEDPLAGPSADIDHLTMTGETEPDQLPSVFYVLEIQDQSDYTQVTSPPMKAVTDLVNVIRSQRDDKKLSEINRRLGAS